MRILKDLQTIENFNSFCCYLCYFVQNSHVVWDFHSIIQSNIEMKATSIARPSFFVSPALA